MCQPPTCAHDPHMPPSSRAARFARLAEIRAHSPRGAARRSARSGRIRRVVALLWLGMGLVVAGSGFWAAAAEVKAAKANTPGREPTLVVPGARMPLCLAVPVPSEVEVPGGSLVWLVPLRIESSSEQKPAELGLPADVLPAAGADGTPDASARTLALIVPPDDSVNTARRFTFRRTGPAVKVKAAFRLRETSPVSVGISAARCSPTTFPPTTTTITACSGPGRT